MTVKKYKNNNNEERVNEGLAYGPKWLVRHCNKGKILYFSLT